ncbi:hypothetical protein cje147_04653 [Campylobacter jejuni subsp. jejuni 2008-872]|nr:hypothetical protein cje147_04653 [Campylobacter jejuni subsp. jejuni 2008-872]EIB75354.1 hypothetical protein cje4_03576 [Campylobacter jejuni subsp. jejuni 140-16]EIB78630.1 hypothetical protein cje75_05951 [Campylobacter jejuni subsp. jejuni 1798]
MNFNLPNLSIKIPANGDKMTTKIAGMVKTKRTSISR